MTDQEIVEVWSRMKVGYPESILSRPNIMEIVRRTFPRYSHLIHLLFRHYISERSIYET